MYEMLFKQCRPALSKSNLLIFQMAEKSWMWLDSMHKFRGVNKDHPSDCSEHFANTVVTLFLHVPGQADGSQKAVSGRTDPPSSLDMMSVPKKARRRTCKHTAGNLETPVSLNTCLWTSGEKHTDNVHSHCTLPVSLLAYFLIGFVSFCTVFGFFVTECGRHSNAMVLLEMLGLQLRPIQLC